jgi:DNA-binding NarL/FixJ family response regulator
MRRREASRAAGVPPDPGRGNREARLQLTQSRNPRNGAELVHKKARVSIGLVDPKPLTRRSIADILATAFPEHVIMAVSTCEELLKVGNGRIGGPALVVVYIRSAGLTAASVQSALDLLRTRLPAAPVVVLSDRDDIDEVNRALSEGVRGYIPTSVECEVAIAALRLIGAGGTFVPANALRAATPKHDPSLEGERWHALALTPRELSVIDLLREGKPNKLIAAQLEMQESTVKVHVRNILKKLRATNRTHAASVANRLLG